MLLAVLAVAASFVSVAAAAVSPTEPAGATAPGPTVPATAPVAAEVRDAVARHGEARVIVLLADQSPAWLPFGMSEWVSSAAGGRVLGALPARAHRGDRTYGSVPLAATTVDADGLARLEASPQVARVVLDEVSRVDLAQSAPMVEAPSVWSHGVTGAGQTVAIVDTGIDSTHPFLGGRVVAGACFSSTVAAFSMTAVCPGADPTRATGVANAGPCPIAGDCTHGTHVAGIAAGGTGTSGSGIAYGANIISLQVFSRVDNTGLCGGAATCALTLNSDQIAALDYVNTTLRLTYSVAAVNMSLGGGLFSAACDTDSRKPIIDALRAHGIATVVAAGNSGKKTSLSSPACISSTISVGATSDTDNTVASYSNSASFLTLLAPGSNIVSSVPGGGFATKSGTSMATPHVVGAFALLRQAYPTATVDAIVTALQTTGTPITDTGITKSRILIQHALDALTGPPQVTSVSPNSGLRTGGVSVVLKGAGFSGVTGVAFGTTPATSFTVDSFNKITAVVPPHTPAYVNVAVTTPKGVNVNALSSWYRYLATFTVTSGTMPSAQVGLPYSFAFTASGTPAPTWSVTNGTLPAGLSMTTNGVVSGVPTTVGPNSLSVTATNGIDTVVVAQSVAVSTLVFTVGSTADQVDASVGDGVCLTASGQCTLRAAVQEANALPGEQDIHLPAGTYTITRPGADEDAAVTGDLDVTGPTVIDGVGATIDGGGLDRVLDIRTAGVTLSGITITDGNVTGDGGGVRFAGTAGGTLTGVSVTANTATGFGGGVAVGAGTVTIGAVGATTQVSANHALVGGGIGSGTGSALTLDSATVSANTASAGGGIGAVSTLSITRSTISANTSTSYGAGVLAIASLTVSASSIADNVSGSLGGGIGALGATTITTTSVTGNRALGGGGLMLIGNAVLSRSTVSGNTATPAGGGGGIVNAAVLAIDRSTVSGNTAPFGAGIYNGGTTFGWHGQLTVTDSTVTANSGGGVGDDIGATASFTNSIVAAQTTGANCTGVVSSGGSNLSSDGSCAWVAAGDVQNVAPLLGPLAANGGSTATHLPQAGSPAIDSGPLTCSGPDQRGSVRPHGSRCDKGSVEV